eukprot:jgi/Ulvmu1/1462/UM011_0192.1
MAYMDWLGRILFASIFLTSGFIKLSNYEYETGGDAMPEIATKLDVAMKTISSNIPSLNFTHRDVQAYYRQLYLAAIVLEVGGAIALIAGYDIGAYALIAFIVPATFVMHDFWNASDNDAASPDIINFMKNVVIVGALLMILSLKAQLRARR